MSASFAVLLALSGSTGMAVQRPSSEQAPQGGILRPTGAIELPGVEGRIDHLAVDLARERAFVAALGNDSLEVVDLKAGTRHGTIAGLSEPQGVVYLADVDRIVVANGGNGACDVFDGATLERLASVEVGDDADNLRYDAAAKRVYVAYGKGALGVVD